MQNGFLSTYTPARHLAEGLAHARKQEMDLAIRDFTDAIQAADREIRCPAAGSLPPYRIYCEALYKRGLAYFQQRKCDLAIKDLEQAEAVCRRTPTVQSTMAPVMDKLAKYVCRARLHRGLTFFDQGAYYAAIEDFTQVISREPSNFEALFHRGLAYKEIWETDKALADFKRAKAINCDEFAIRAPCRSAVGPMRPGNAAETAPGQQIPVSDKAPATMHAIELPAEVAPSQPPPAPRVRGRSQDTMHDLELPLDALAYGQPSVVRGKVPATKQEIELPPDAPPKPPAPRARSKAAETMHSIELPPQFRQDKSR